MVDGLADLPGRAREAHLVEHLLQPRTELAPEDLVLGVRVGEEAHAFPVRAIAYHHVVNDVVAGTPIVATY